MQPYRYHVFACDQRKPEGVPCCSARGSGAVLERLRREVAARGLLDTVQVTACGSLGLCERGPNVVVYPEGVWYSGVQEADVPEIVSEHFQHGRPVARLANSDAAAVAREIAESRRRMLEGMRVREAAGVVPDDLSDLVRGFQASRIVLSALELDLFSAIEALGGGATAPSVAAHARTDPRATGILLDALVALGLLSKQGDVLANGPVARRFLAAGAPADARAALRHNASLWRTWSTLTDVVRSGRPAPQPELRERGEDWTTPFIAAMHRHAALRAPVLVAAVGAGQVSRLLDVGGGSGAYTIAFAQANPALVADVLDLEPVLAIAARHVAEAGLSGRVRTRAGDLRRDPLGSGYDLVLLSAICHMLSPDENRDLLRRCAEALVPGGRIAIADQLMDEARTAPRSGALFAVNMLVNTPGGSTYTASEYGRWLGEAGFGDVRRLPLPGPGELLIARRS